MEYTNSFLPLAPLLAGWCALAAAAAALLLAAAISAWLQRPRRVAEAFRRQGIDGPPPSSFLSGNLSEMQARAAAAAVALAILIGLAGTWRILGQKPAPYLRQM